jgi:hypothetical protein
MNALLVALVLAGMIEPKPPARVIEHSAQTSSTASTAGGSVVVVADGSRSWSGVEADATVEQLQFELDSKWSVHVARFDSERTQDGDLVVAGSNRDLVQVRPRTPMKEAIALTLNDPAVRDRVSAMVVIAHAQVTPTYVETDRLIESLRRSGIQVYAIHLSGRKRPSAFRRLGYAVTAGTVWIIQALIEEDREAQSSKTTAGTLKFMSGETGGLSCAAPDRRAALGCAETIATRINEAVRSGASDRPTGGSGRKP